jgi:hypothetical protein
MVAKTRHKIWMVKIQHFPISSKFDMWVDNDVPNWFPTLKNFYRSPFSKWPPQYRKNSTLSTYIWNVVEIGQCWICAVLWWPFWKWRPVEIFQCRESIRDIIIYPHIKFWWYRTMLNFYRPFLCRVFCSHFHETWWSYRYMFLVDPKVFRFVVKGVKAIYLGVQRGWGLL